MLKSLKDTTFTSVYYLLIYFTFLAFLEALPHLCQHVNLVGGDSDSRAVLYALIGLMEDSDPMVRIRFSQSVRFLLTETTRNSEHGSLNEVSISCCKTQVSVLYTQFQPSTSHHLYYKYITVRQKRIKYILKKSKLGNN